MMDPLIDPQRQKSRDRARRWALAHPDKKRQNNRASYHATKHLHKKPWSLAYIRTMLKWASNKCDRIDRMFYKYQHTAPWRLFGYKGDTGYRQWLSDDPSIARIHLLPFWKSRTYDKLKKSGLLVGAFTERDWLTVLDSFDWQCAYCRVTSDIAASLGHTLEVDHVIGVAVRDANPEIASLATNTIGNIVPACKACNASKSDLFVLAWMRRKCIDLSSCHPSLIPILSRIRRAMSYPTDAMETA